MHRTVKLHVCDGYIKYIKLIVQFTIVRKRLTKATIIRNYANFTILTNLCRQVTWCVGLDDYLS